MSGPSLSVVMAVYNGEPFLAAAIESVLRQSFQDFEFVVVDDGSTDRTPQLLDEYARQDTRMVLHRSDHVGQPTALNLGLERASADLVARIDADDLALPGRFQRQVDFLVANQDVVLLGGGARLINRAGERFADEFPPASDAELRRQLASSNPFYHSSVAFRRTDALQSGGYRADFDQSDDYDLWLRLAERGAVAGLAHLLAAYRFSSQQKSIADVERQAATLLAARKCARARRAGKPESLVGSGRIDPDLLIEKGVDGGELARTIWQLARWYAEKMHEAGEAELAGRLERIAASNAPA